MTTTSVGATQISSGLDITSGNSLLVASGGVVSTSTIENGAFATDSGFLFDTNVAAGGTVFTYGSSLDDQVHGSEQALGGGAVVNAATVFAGGALELLTAGSIASNTVLSGGGLVISGRGDAINTTLDTGASITLESPKATLSGSLVFAGSATLETTVVISGPSGGSSFGDQAVISGFGQGDTIDLTVVSGGVLSFATSGLVPGATLEAIVSGGGATQSFFFAGVTSNNLTAVPDGGTGTDIGFVACYAAGTLILTERGEVPVETLAAEDRVLSALGGGWRRVRWVGCARVQPTRARNPAASQPVRIAAGAFGGGLPRRDLRLSPEHAVLVDGVLIPARHLINGTNVVQESVEAVDYYHIELDAHDAVYAEGLPAETWLDTGNRWMFENAGIVAIAPAFPTTQAAAACAPMVERGPALDVVRRRLAVQASAMGLAPVHAMAVPLTTGTVTALVPAGIGLVRLVCATGWHAADRRALGAAVAALDLDGVALRLDDPALGLGWHGIEGGEGARWRWTDGEALIALDRAASDRLLRVEVVALGRAVAA